jgi:RNA polymerase sigma-B factor
MAGDVASQDATAEAFVSYFHTRDQKTRDQLVSSYLPLARSVARRFANRGEPYDDLVQVASLALLKAVDRFDPFREVQFSTFAVSYMLGELKRYFRDRGWAIRAPRRLQEIYLAVGDQVDRLSQELKRAPTIAEIAEAVGTTEESVLEALEAGRSYRTTSLDAAVDAGQRIRDISGSDSQMAQIDELATVAPIINQLPARNQLILKLRFFDGLTQSDIAARLGVSQMQISRLLASTLEMLRRVLNEQADGAE